MASEAIAGVVEFLRANSPMAGETIQEMRESMDAATGIVPLPEDVTYEPIDVAGIPAEWTSAPGVDPERVVLYFHGGGYTIGGIASHRGPTADLSRATGARVLSVDYRLAPEHPFPAAIDDSVAAYRYLCSQGFAPGKIAVAGDSAGGGITAATLIALRDAGDPLPAAGVCISPWLDLTQSSESFTIKAEEDPLVSKQMLDMMADAYLNGADPKSPLASPRFADLEGLCPMLVQVGSAEVLLDDSRSFAERAKAAGVDIELEIWDDMIHVWHAFSVMLPEGEEAMARIGEYLNDRFA